MRSRERDANGGSSGSGSGGSSGGSGSRQSPQSPQSRQSRQSRKSRQSPQSLGKVSAKPAKSAKSRQSLGKVARENLGPCLPPRPRPPPLAKSAAISSHFTKQRPLALATAREGSCPPPRALPSLSATHRRWQLSSTSVPPEGMCSLASCTYLVSWSRRCRCSSVLGGI